MSTTINPSNSIWPNGLKLDEENYTTFYSLGTNKVTIPATAEEWPEGDTLISPFVYQDGKLVGFCDTKSFILNDSATTDIPYEFIKANFPTIEDGKLAITSPNCQNPEIKYQKIKSLPAGYKRLEYLESQSTENKEVHSYFRIPLDITTYDGTKTGVTIPEYTFTYETEHMYYNNTNYKQCDGCNHDAGCFLVGVAISGRPKGFVFVSDGWRDLSIKDETHSWGNNDRFFHNDPTWINNTNYVDYRHFYYDVNWPTPYEYAKVRLSFGNIKNPKLQYWFNDEGPLINKEVELKLDDTNGKSTRKAFYLFGTPATSPGTANPYRRSTLCGRKKYAKIWVNDSLIYHLIPCLDDLGNPCFYNLVNGETFWAEVGEFITPPNEYALQTLDLDTIRYAKKTERGIQRLYKVPEGENISLEEYAKANNFKELIETECPSEGHWVHEWVETDTQLILQWSEIVVPEDTIIE